MNINSFDSFVWHWQDKVLFEGYGRILNIFLLGYILRNHNLKARVGQTLPNIKNKVNHSAHQIVNLIKFGESNVAHVA